MVVPLTDCPLANQRRTSTPSSGGEGRGGRTFLIFSVFLRFSVVKSSTMSTCGNYGPPFFSRREMLRRSGLGLGSIAFAWLLDHDAQLCAAPTSPLRPWPVPGPAKNIILLHMGGGVSQVDSFDPKPALEKYAGKNVPDSIAARVPKGNRRLRTANLLPSHWEFKQHGQSGTPVSVLFPNMARCVDELCVIRSMHHDSPIHTPADYLTLTGSLTGQRPSLGAWFAYGLGSENQNLPAFITMVTGENFSGPALWASGFLPPEFQGSRWRNGGRNWT
jgi:uncharacterized protein DUF1501